MNVEAAHIHEIEEFGTAASAGEVHEEDGRRLSFTPASISLGRRTFCRLDVSKSARFKMLS